MHATVSLGLTALRPDDSTVDAVIQGGDEALYQAKSASRDTIQVRRNPGDQGVV